MGIYNAEVSAGSLMLPESRKIAAFLLTKPDEAAWTRAFILGDMSFGGTATPAHNLAESLQVAL